ncbi:Hypothetical protein ETEE_2009 [Edwardsiella anguillarum ET080813]|uniref:Uncharacterized protein n=1 Tax=Edwardsiella anguillarum ET080813 TaxID=667120 RepID=A0A076LS80_9GAMM|nr:Hypothetical protein ETEE_2009 [Edwardsiella anguillarum ET080813]
MLGYLVADIDRVRRDMAVFLSAQIDQNCAATLRKKDINENKNYYSFP